MAIIHVPKPRKTAWDPRRPVSALLRMQIEHLHDAERRLPPRFHTDIYVNAIKTEGEAARYIRETTEAIHAAHAAAERARLAPRRKRALEIAAAAEGKTRKRKNTRKSGTSKSRKKK